MSEFHLEDPGHLEQSEISTPCSEFLGRLEEIDHCLPIRRCRRMRARPEHGFGRDQGQQSSPKPNPERPQRKVAHCQHPRLNREKKISVVAKLFLEFSEARSRLRADDFFERPRVKRQREHYEGDR